VNYCDVIVECPDNRPIQCGYQCFPTRSDCPNPPSCFPGVECWDGNCAPTVADCQVIPACPYYQKRCSDGQCHPIGDPCTTPICTAPDQLCGNGTCHTDCPRALGCPADGVTIQCPDGSCAQSIENCSLSCNGTIERKCWGECVPLEITCNDTLWISKTFDNAWNFINKDSTQSEWKQFDTYNLAFEDFFVRIIYPADTGLTSHKGAVRAVDRKYVEQVGPLSTWDTGVEVDYIRSGIFNFTLEGNGDQSASLFMAYQRYDSELFITDGRWESSNLCFAQAVDWYWSARDATSKSNESYIVEYRTLVESGNATEDQIFNIPRPKYRWRCLDIPVLAVAETKLVLATTIPDNTTAVIVVLSKFSGPADGLPPIIINLPAHWALIALAATSIVAVIIYFIFKKKQEAEL